MTWPTASTVAAPRVAVRRRVLQLALLPGPSVALAFLRGEHAHAAEGRPAPAAVTGRTAVAPDLPESPGPPGPPVGTMVS
ncbi:hypothetical protein [Streptomyces sp. NPDC017435]|uniref:hypothetical protein n=1 Tax=Streptomyces sp. NPDC017435 TaxID=3364995 RepID=UPI0037B2353F